jgi:hypothetical protein
MRESDAMAQNINEPVAVLQRSGVGTSVDSWAVLAEDTPVFAAGDSSAAARVAAAILDDAREIRRAYEEEMLSMNVNPRMLELHELLHDAERHSLAAQRHGVECLTARLRDDSSSVAQISAQTFEKTQLAAVALGDAFRLIDAANTPGERALEIPPQVPAERIDVLDDSESERRAARADRARRIRPVPEQIPSVAQPRQRSLTDQPWQRRNARDEKTEARPSNPTVEQPAQPHSTDIVATRGLSTVGFSEAVQLEVLASSESRARDSPAQMWLYRALIVVLVALIAVGLWLLLSDNAFIG